MIPKNDQDLNDSVRIAQQAVEDANSKLIDYMYTTLESASHEIEALRNRVSATYWIIVVLSIVMFTIGVILISVPAIAMFREDINQWMAFVSAGSGLANLTALFLFRPLTRLHRLMGDMGQITVVLNSFQTQVALRLLESDATDRESLGQAADHVGQAAQHALSLIQTYFEEDRIQTDDTVHSLAEETGV